MESNDSLITGFCREVDENCALLGCYAARGGNSLPTFRYNLSALSSRVDNPGLWILDPWSWDRCFVTKRR